MNKIVFLISCIICFTQILSAQSVIGTTGNSVKSSDRTLEYSLGQIAIETVKSSNRILTQGVLQPNFKVSVSVNENFDKKYSFKVFPNPTYGILNISTDFPDFLSYQIIDYQGRTIALGNYNNAGTIDFTSYPNGSYFIQLISKDFSKNIQLIKQ